MSIFKDDPFGEIKKPVNRAGPPPREVNLFHARDDVDSDVNSHHHTLGIKHTQASIGDHVHDGVSSRKLGQGLNLQVNVGVSTAADLSALIAMLHNVIEFEET